MSKKIIGIDLGGTSVKLAILSQNGEILQKWSIQTNTLDEGKNIIADIIQSLKEHIELYQLKPEEILGIGMGSPGKVDVEEKTVTGAYNLGWKTKQEIGKQFQEAFEQPFFIGNDANIAALGEQWQGAGLNLKDVVMFTIGTGVGGGIVANGQLVTGAGGAAGEIGHLAVDFSDEYHCTCGKVGCLEAVASATGIQHLARHLSAEFAGMSVIKQLIDDGQEITSKMIFDEAQKGDKFANIVVDQFCQYLAIAVSHIANTLSPNKIVIGGGVSAAGEFLVDKIRQKAVPYIFPQIRTTCDIVLAQLGNDAGVVGAAQLVNLSL